MTIFKEGTIVHFLQETVDGDLHIGYYKAVKDFDIESEKSLFKASDQHLVPCSIEGWDYLYAENRYVTWLLGRGVLVEQPVARIDIDSSSKTGLSQYLLNES